MVTARLSGKAERRETLAAPHPEHRIVAVAVLANDGPVLVVTGDLRILAVPRSAFAPGGTGTAPDFSRPMIDDYGHTLMFGEYEAAADAVMEGAARSEVLL